MRILPHFLLLSSTILSQSVNADWLNIRSPREPMIEVAKPAQREILPELLSSSITNKTLHSTQIAELSQTDSELLLHKALNQGDVATIEALLAHYQQFSNTDQTLIEFASAQLAYKAGEHSQAAVLFRAILAREPQLTPVRIRLAMTLYQLNDDSAARTQFEQALSDQALPPDIAVLIQTYLEAIDRRNEWQFTFSTHYLRERNVNNASDAAYIENTPFKKNAASLPQRANGIAYGIGVERDMQLTGNHFGHFANELNGKLYWDNRDFDEMTNRTYLGYVKKQGDYRIAVLPFYERQWYSGERYKWAKGVRISGNYWLNPHWQVSAAGEYSQARYFDSDALNGNNRLLSLTLLWRINPQRFISLGVDFSRENPAVRQYGYDLKSVRLGLGEEWKWGISARATFSYGERHYKDSLSLAGGAFRFDKARKDKIYQASATFWKRDWHLWGITPKLNVRWKKQTSNFASLYAYRDHSVNILLEKAF